MKEIDYEKMDSVDFDEVVKNLLAENSQLSKSNAILVAQVRKYKKLTDILFTNVPDAFPDEITKESEINDIKS